MALIQCDFFSETLGVSSSMNVILPQQTTAQVGMEVTTGQGQHPVLWLLHGWSDDHTIWCRRTSIERYVAPLGLAVVMPAVNLSYYADMHSGLDYWTYISEELPSIARNFFPISDKREDNFLAGLSMGGYGAFKLALAHPERYAAAASLSGALAPDPVQNAKDPKRKDHMQWIFGDTSTFQGSNNDLLALASKLKKENKKQPALYACCGTDDFLYEQNQTFKAHAEKIGLELTYEEGPGTHEWGFWDLWIQRILEWLPLNQFH
jgi:putative tributyrin esterase